MPAPGPSPADDMPAGPQRGKALDPKALPIESLTFDEIAAANRQAQIDGVGVGACAGIVGNLLSTRVFRQNRNVGLLSALLTATVTGYLFTQASLQTHLAAASRTASTLRSHLDQSPNALNPDVADRASAAKRWDFDKEGGTQGLEKYEDKYATTRGDH